MAVYIRKEELKRIMLDEKKTWKEACAYFQCSTRTLGKYLQKYNLNVHQQNRMIKKKAEKLIAKRAFEEAEKLYKDATEREQIMERTLKNLEGASILIKQQIESATTTKHSERMSEIRMLKDLQDSIVNAYKEYVALSDEAKERQKAYIFRQLIIRWIQPKDQRFVDEFLQEALLVEGAVERFDTSYNRVKVEETSRLLTGTSQSDTQSDNINKQQE